MPGVKDTCSVKVDGARMKVYKRLLLMDLKELHTLFKKSYPGDPVSFSAFAKLRPQHCILYLLYFGWSKRNALGMRMHNPPELQIDARFN